EAEAGFADDQGQAVSIRVELDPVERVTAAAIGEPGQRTFYLQARKDDVMVTLLLEKQQVAMLSTHIDELLGNVTATADAGPDLEALDLEEPIEPEFRVGRIGLGYDEERDLVLMQCDEYQPESEEGAEEGEEAVLETADGQLRLWATRAQMNALARR